MTNESEFALQSLGRKFCEIMDYCVNPTEISRKAVKVILYVSGLHGLEVGIPQAAMLLHVLGLMRAH